MIKVSIAYGLPGSGKTYYGQQIEQTGCVNVISMDDYIHDGQYESIEDILDRRFNLRYYSPNDFYIDSLITMNAVLIDVIGTIDRVFKKWNRRYCLEVIHWNENRVACRKNIAIRNDGRNVSTTIDNLPYEPVNQTFITDELRKINPDVTVTFKERRIYMDTIWDNYFQPLTDSHNSDGSHVYSDEWSLGGTWCNCWGESGTIAPEPQPKSFEIFDELLGKVCPNITYLQYKKLYEACVSIEHSECRDYYGGVENKAKYALDVRKCYDMLRDMDLIKE